MRCDSQTGYVYDMDIYAGKDEVLREGYLGERVVKKLASSIKEKDVTLALGVSVKSVDLVAGRLGFYSQSGLSHSQLSRQALGTSGSAKGFVYVLFVMLCPLTAFNHS